MHAVLLGGVCTLTFYTYALCLLALGVVKACAYGSRYHIIYRIIALADRNRGRLALGSATFFTDIRLSRTYHTRLEARLAPRTTRQPAAARRAAGGGAGSGLQVGSGGAEPTEA